MASPGILNTKKRIRLGIWGLGRGMSFYHVCSALNFDVVAGCDFNRSLRDAFLAQNPGAFVTDNAEEFLQFPMDAVLLATYCTAHADDAIACLRAGKHVLSEVTAFHTLAEGVRLVEAVEKSGLVYNLAENYPFTCPNLYLAAKWSQGLFGELMYAEYEYVHEVRQLAYTWLNGTPIEPGWQPHHWRSWLNFHYYNTHSLGPVMHITNTRPVRVVSLPGGSKLAGYLQEKAIDGMCGIAPSLITMSNGGIMRNLMGATTNDSHVQRLWGTKGASEIIDGRLSLRLGGSGSSPKLPVDPQWPELAQYADAMGHGGGDFWVLYHFARHILFGKPAFFDVYRAADCTIPGILALRSAMENGKPYDVPDFRRKSERGQHRNNHWAQKPYDVEKGCFPKSADKAIVGCFNAVMKDAIHAATLCRAAIDWIAVADDARDPAPIIDLLGRFLRERPSIRQTFAQARAIISASPRSDGARALGELLDLADAARATSDAFTAQARNQRNRLKRKITVRSKKPKDL